MERSWLIDEFLRECGLQNAVREPLPGDASFRRYERIRLGETTRMLMDAPPPHENVRPFIAVTDQLRDWHLSAPQIHGRDEAQGFLLLEDFGDRLFTQLLSAQPEQEAGLYVAATDVLLRLRQSPAPAGLEPYDDAALLREVSVFTDWFLPQIMDAKRAAAAKTELLDLWTEILADAALRREVVVLRDFHADNLMWLPEREGVARVGLLDYQDALLGDPAYDMVSFLQDARRDVSPETIAMCLQHYWVHSGDDVRDFKRRYAILGAQRNTKIVGIFTRLCVRDGKAQYLHHLPRVWRWLAKDLQHESLAPLGRWMDAHIPPAVRETPIRPQAVA